MMLIKCMFSMFTVAQFLQRKKEWMWAASGGVWEFRVHSQPLLFFFFNLIDITTFSHSSYIES